MLQDLGQDLSGSFIFRAGEKCIRRPTLEDYAPVVEVNVVGNFIRNSHSCVTNIRVNPSAGSSFVVIRTYLMVSGSSAAVTSSNSIIPGCMASVSARTHHLHKTQECSAHRCRFYQRIHLELFQDQSCYYQPSKLSTIVMSDSSYGRQVSGFHGLVSAREFGSAAGVFDRGTGNRNQCQRANAPPWKTGAMLMAMPE